MADYTGRAVHASTASHKGQEARLTVRILLVSEKETVERDYWLSASKSRTARVYRKLSRAIQLLEAEYGKEKP